MVYTYELFQDDMIKLRQWNNQGKAIITSNNVRKMLDLAASVEQSINRLEVKSNDIKNLLIEVSNHLIENESNDEYLNDIVIAIGEELGLPSDDTDKVLEFGEFSKYIPRPKLMRTVDENSTVTDYELDELTPFELGVTLELICELSTRTGFEWVIPFLDNFFEPSI